MRGALDSAAVLYQHALRNALIPLVTLQSHDAYTVTHITNVAVLDKSYIGSGAAGRNTTIIRANYRTPEGAAFYSESVKLYEKLDRFHTQLTAGDAKAEITAVDHWGRRELAYPIENHLEGVYSVVRLKLDPTTITAIERDFRLNESVIRHLLIRPVA